MAFYLINSVQGIWKKCTDRIWINNKKIKFIRHKKQPTAREVKVKKSLPISFTMENEKINL